MHSLEALRRLNSRPPCQPSVELRESSAVLARGGVVVHSAKLRSTAFIPPRAKRAWWNRWMTADITTRHRMADDACREAGRDSQRLKTYD